VKRARKAAANAARVRDGTEQPVPFAALPRAIAERVARTGAAGARPGRKRAAPPSKGGGKRPRRDSRSRSSSAARDTDSGVDAHASGGMNARDAEASREPKSRMTIASLVGGDAEAAARVAAIWHAAVDADACHVCGAGASDRWGDDDEIVFCDGCDVQVHLSCYGLKRVPKGKWLCQGCEDGVHPGDVAAGEVGTCALCPQPGGALAVLDPPSHWDVAWETPGTHAHVSCASCLPEVFVWKDVPGRETRGAVVDMSFVKAPRINLSCSLCKQEGACTQCAMRKCFATFHPLCARGAGFATERHASQDGRHLWFCRRTRASAGGRRDARRRGWAFPERRRQARQAVVQEEGVQEVSHETEG
jgi:SWI/SNF-related matrix-associated actin-dependent regulator of chromatin subfamily A member 5